MITAGIPRTLAEDTAPVNAAPLYLKIWDADHHEYVDSRAIAEETEGVERDGWVAGPRILAELSNEERMMRIDAAVGAGSCEFDLDLSEGPMLELPHHAPACAAAGLLLAQARIDCNTESYDAAFDDIRKAFVIARHLSSDHFLITTRARARIITPAVYLAFRIPQDQWRGGSAELLLRELDRFPDHDRLELRRSVLRDSELISDWMVAQSQSVAGRQRIWAFVDSLRSIDGGDETPSSDTLWPEVEEYGGLERCGEAQRTIGMLRAEAIAEENPDLALDRITGRITDGEFGPLAPFLSPDIDRVFQDSKIAETLVYTLQNCLRDSLKR
ncbi:MAG: hypothetical protein H6814_05625 [Phycisphaeraceae bacterium]|nr:hypothetical protein [Phycisphaeraceae bacterium]